MWGVRLAESDSLVSCDADWCECPSGDMLPIATVEWWCVECFQLGQMMPCVAIDTCDRERTAFVEHGPFATLVDCWCRLACRMGVVG